MKLLLAGVLLLTSQGCRKDNPPQITICIGDGLGGMDCILKDGTPKYLAPSETLNMWATTQEDMAAFASWCYKINKSDAEEELAKMRDNINGD